MVRHHQSVETSVRELMEQETALRELDVELIARSMRLIGESRELLHKIDNLLRRSTVPPPPR
jgi:hypothetical protein